MKILSGNQFKELDRYTIEHEPVPSIDLMERASQEVAIEIMHRWDTNHRMLVFAGPGNNGGDGLAVARLLGSNGYTVMVWLFNVKDKLSDDCETNRQRLRSVPNITLTEVQQGFDFPTIQPTDIVVDALFGTGLNRAMSGGFAHVVHKINASHPLAVVSIDVPSGLMCEDNTYNDMNNVVRASVTLSIQIPKLTFMLPDTAEHVGEWKLLDIGLSEEGLDQMGTSFHTMETEDIRHMLRPRPRFAHKGTMGHALLVAGSTGMAGAAILSSTACLRSGIGKLSLHTSAGNRQIMQTAVPEAVLCAENNSRNVSYCSELSQYQAIGIGPGLGTDAATVMALEQYLAMADVPVVVDADAINILAINPEWLRHLPTGSILTPHPKELDRLVGQSTNSYERLMRALDLAIQHQIFVVLKGHHTAVCTPTGRAIFCTAGNSGMATAGSGDVLTGIITGLLTQGYSPTEATQLGVWLHATAGDLAADELEPECMLASDITRHLGGAYKILKNKK